MSTIPSRINKIGPALFSLMDQSVRPHCVCLAAPSFSIREQRPYSIPDWLKNIPGVRIVDSPRDYGPATKLIPVLKQAPDGALVIAVDDDNVHPPNFVETFARFGQKYPRAALSLRGWPMPRSLRWKDSREITGDRLSRPIRTDVITGCGGAAVRPEFFGPEFFQTDGAPDEVFYTDDIWISGHLAARGVPRLILPIPCARIYLPSLRTVGTPSLFGDHNKDGANNDAAIRLFKPHWSVGIH